MVLDPCVYLPDETKVDGSEGGLLTFTECCLPDNKLYNILEHIYFAENATVNVWEISAMGRQSTQESSSITETHYVVGRRGKTDGGTLTLGRYYALDGSLGAQVFLDVTRPHVVFICGKRGYGKSYSIGVLLEEICRLKDVVRERLGVIVVDTLGVFWTMHFPNVAEKTQLARGGSEPQGFPVRLLVPMKTVAEFRQQSIDAVSFSLRVASVSAAHWCHLFGVKSTDPISITLSRAVLSMQARSDCFSIHDLVVRIQQDDRASDLVKTAAENFLAVADSWKIFNAKGLAVTDLVKRGVVSILDLSSLPSQPLKDVVVSLISEAIFEAQVQARRAYEEEKVGLMTETAGLPLVWLAVDEAQVFIPRDHDTLSKEVLLTEWMRQGRQPGLSLILATQRPSALEPEVLSHADIIVCHRLTAQEDIDMLGLVRPTYMRGDIAESIKKMGDEKGVALLVDDTSESVHVIKVRPRMSRHGGGEPEIIL